MVRVVLLSIVLASCQVLASDRDCDLADWNGLIGEDQRMLLSYKLPPKTRVISPNSAVTTDHVPERLNIYLDANKRVERVSCG